MSPTFYNRRDDMPDCTNCNRNQADEVPYIVHEGTMARMERTVKRLWVTIILLIAMLVATNGAWLYYENQYQDEVTITQENEDGYNNYVGNVGDITNG